MKRFVFLDIDGTLCDMSGEVPDTTKEAICKARKNGHKMFLCTGRSVSEINPSIRQIGFDGIVAGAGAYVECEKQAVFHKTLEENIVKDLITFMEKEKISYVLERNEGCIITKHGMETLKKVFEEKNVFSEEERVRFLDSLNISEEPFTIQNINKILYFNSKCTVEEFTQKFGSKLLILPSSIEAMGEQSGEISDKKIHKATGIEKILAYYNENKDKVIAIGDGLNDIEMIQYANVGIAMGNGHPKLKGLADYITESVQNDGIQKCFLHYKLIE